MGIPAARDALSALAMRMDCPMYISTEINKIVDMMYRKPPASRATPRAKRMTKELAKQLVEYKAAHPDVPNREIGAKFGVDGGRVSEQWAKAAH